MLYYYEKNGVSVGPLPLEDLKGQITIDTLVWYEGLDNWIKASEVPDIKTVFEKKPPPLPKTENVLKVEATIKKEKVDLITEKSQNKIANEIKYNIFLLFAAVAIGFGAMIYKNVEMNRQKILALGYSLKSYQNEPNPYKDIVDDGQRWNTKGYGEYLNKWGKKMDSFRMEANYLGCSIPYDKVISDSYLKQRLEQIDYVSKKFAFEMFMYAFIGLVGIRYLIISLNWVSKKST